MRVLILAHGDGRRWNVGDAPYLGHPKHFVTVDGETLLGRAVRLMVDRGADVTVVGPDDRYRVDGADLVSLDAINVCGSDMGKFLDTRHLWSGNDRTVIMWGDVYYTDACADSIAGYTGGGYHVWRRPGSSKTTGHRWDESFAVSFDPADHEQVAAQAERIAGLVGHKIKATHIRTHLAAMCGVRDSALDDVRRTATLPMQTHINDWTDDFDSPAEWRGWMGRRMAGRYRLAVCVPWCGGDEFRARSFDWTRRHWESLGVPVFTGGDDTDGRWPNRSAMRNRAARQAIADDAEVLFFADADTFVAGEQMWAAAHLAMERGQFVLAFDEYLRIGRTRSLAMIGSRYGPRFERQARIGAAYRSDTHASGATAISTAAFEAIGGYDERFRSWGGEDRAFWLACLTVFGEAPRVSGPAFHWWHPKAVDKVRTMPQYLANIDLGLRYKTAAAWTPKAGALPEIPEGATPDLEAMMEILSEPGAPLERVAVV